MTAGVFIIIIIITSNYWQERKGTTNDTWDNACNSIHVIIKRQLAKGFIPSGSWNGTQIIRFGGKYLYPYQAFLLLLILFVFQDRVSLCNPGCSGPRSVVQAGLTRGLPLPPRPQLYKKVQSLSLWKAWYNIHIESREKKGACVSQLHHRILTGKYGSF